MTLLDVERPTYTARYESDGRFWFVRVVEIQRGTQARDFDEIQRKACELIMLALDVPANSFRVRVEEGTPPA